MIAIKNLLHFFGYAQKSVQDTNAKKIVEEKPKIKSHNGPIKTELINISQVPWKEQAELRNTLTGNYLRYFSETALLETFSEIYLDEGSDKECKKQAALCLDEALNTYTNQDLHDYITNEVNHPLARKFAIHKLIERKDTTANLTFIYRIISDDDNLDVRKAAAIGLGELGSSGVLEPLKNVQKEDSLYEDAQKTIEKINKRMGENKCQL